ncbi:MAG: Uma2 family endonuclease [Spirosomaceae bacterium]|jgi:hypothetical protein|nr:Uma2 family endonuclease [Spirosomataceae bacterium]
MIDAPEKRKKRKVSLPVQADVIPEYLIREMLNGVPYYYKNYQQVLTGKKHIEDIMGASSLQSFIVSYLFRLLIKADLETKYHILVSEPGLHIDRRTNLSGDILIYEKAQLTPDKITVKYADIPALVDVEVDVKVDMSREKDFEYVMHKTQKLLDFGTGKVVWVFTESQKVMIAQPQQPWITYDWNTTLEMLDGVMFNIAQYLAEEGITATKRTL